MTDAPDWLVEKVARLLADRYGEYADAETYDMDAARAVLDLVGQEAEALRAERDAALAEVERLQRFIASDVSRAAGLLTSIVAGPVVAGDTHEAYLQRFAPLCHEQAEKLDAGIRAALQGKEG